MLAPHLFIPSRDLSPPAAKRRRKEPYITLSPPFPDLYKDLFPFFCSPHTAARIKGGKRRLFFILGRPLKAEVTKVLLSLFPPINRPLLHRKRKCGLKKRRRRGKVIFRLLPSSLPSRSNSRLARARGKEKN